MLPRKLANTSRIAIGLLAGTLCLSTGFSQAGSASYIGAVACAQCHPEQTRQWTGSHHDLAMQPANSTTVKGDFDNATHTRDGITTKFFRRDQQFMIRTEGSDGKMADFEVSYTFGTDPLQQYLIVFPDGRFQVMGLAWDTRPRELGGQHWYSLYPHETIPHNDVLHWTQPSQNWNHMCAECHSTNLRKGYLGKSNSFATQWSEINVACEACHGPGSEHRQSMKAHAEGNKPKQQESGLAIEFPSVASVQWTVESDTGKPIRSATRVEHLEVEVCARCHARRSTLAEAVLPGHTIHDSHRVEALEPPLYFADGQIRGEVYVYGSFIQSAMYAAGVTCSDCHDPHSGTLRAQGNDLCTRCHPAGRFDVPQHHHHSAGSVGARCIECHMPSRIYMGIDERHDHSLRIPRPDLSQTIDTPNACNGCHVSMTRVWATQQVETWFGKQRRNEPHWGSAIHAAESSALDAEARLLEMLSNPSTPGIARATALSLLPRFAGPKSLSMFSEAIGDEDPFVRTAALAALDGFPPQVRGALAARSLADPVRSVRFEAARVLASVPASQLGMTSSQRSALLLEYREALERDGDRAEAHMQLGAIAVGEENLDLAQQEYELARNRNPSFIPAYVNLADLYRIRDMDSEAERVLRSALEIVPNQADARHALGLVLVRLNRLKEALQELESAATQQPGNPRYAFVYAVALHTAGEIDRARSVLRQASARHPADRDLRSFLADLETAR